MKRFLHLAPCWFGLAALLAAHPMGNFSVSHYTRIEVAPRGAVITYVLDLAEIPTFEMLRDWKLDAKSPQAELEAKAAGQAQVWMRGLEFRAGGRSLASQPKFVAASIHLSDGAGGLSVARITSTLRFDDLRGSLEFEDHNFPERAGWKEIVIRSSDGAEIDKASQGAADRSQALTVYPADPTSAAPQDLRASVEWKADRPIKTTSMPPSSSLSSSPPSSLSSTPASTPKIVPIEQPKPVATQVPAPPPSSTPSVPQPPGAPVSGDFLSGLLGRKDIGPGLMLIGILAAFGLGAVHALSPGHGKTIVAAYLVGSRGTAKHAAFLGAMVTFTHTISVFLLGLGTLLLAQYIVPEKIIPVLGAISGLSIVAIGASLFYQRLRRLTAAHSPHSHDHYHHDHAHQAHVVVDHDPMHIDDPVHDHDHGHVHTHGDAHEHGRSHAHEPMHIDDPVHDHDHGHVQTQGDAHAHDHAHPHAQGHRHDHGPHGHSHVPEGDITLGSLVALGASGGLVPCPSALVLLLSSVALGHIGLGLVLLVGFSFGLAGVLMGIGMLVLYAKHFLPDPAETTRHPAFRLVPVVSAFVIVCLGLVMTGVSLGWVRPGGLAG